MAVPILTENSILVYDFASSRSQIIPFEKIIRVHHENDAPVTLLACSGPVQKDELRTLSCSVDKNQSMRQRRRTGFFQILLWALVFGDYFNLKVPYEKKKKSPAP